MTNHSPTYIKGIQLLSASELGSLKTILLDYGKYMYEQLGLTAGKSSYYSEMNHFSPEKYLKPDGAFFLAVYEGLPAGCIGLRRFNDVACEMKRMYVCPQFRRQGIGQALCGALLETAKLYGYTEVLLDTNQEMSEAVSLYVKLGFHEVEAYCNNENPHPVYLRKELA